MEFSAGVVMLLSLLYGLGLRIRYLPPSRREAFNRFGPSDIAILGGLF
jgi:hypothetical protein